MEVQTTYLIIGYFVGFEKYGIDVFYNRKFQKWLFENSTDADKNIHPEFDTSGFIMNVKFTAFHNSIPLTENDFIDIQIQRLNTFLELEDLKSMDKIQIQHFKRHLENKSIEYQQHTIKLIQEQNDINEYIQSYRYSFFNSLLNKRNEDGKENVLFYGRRTVELLNLRDEKLNLIDNLKERFDLLNLYNSHLNHLINHIIHLYKALNGYYGTNNTGFLTIIVIEKEKVFYSLKSLKSFSKNIKDEVISGKTDKAILIKTYFLSELDVLIAFLDDMIGIDISKSPLHTDFEAVKTALNSSFILEELKIINDLETKTNKDTQEVNRKINAPILALFCRLINEIGIEKKEEIESVEKYCIRVCERYELVYTDRIRQNFNGNNTKANLKIFIEKVLPLLDAETKSKIQKHLDTKQPPKQNLYA
ncbi:MAG: hypothetical protein B7Y83_05905 [Flavobacteriales bacterium 32-34-25]|nr:MAG: hypothetical protein B7Y83_05905 [Flavobacteriales bacterium 32-34-25]